MQTFVFVLICIVVNFALSLTATYILFARLHSSARIAKDGKTFGGAIAGFLAIFTIVFALVYKVIEPAEKITALEAQVKELQSGSKDAAAGLESWTVVGKAQKRGKTFHDKIDVKVIPSTSAITDKGGNFHLENVYLETGSWPDLYLSADDVYPANLFLKEKCCDRDEVKKQIRIRETEILEPIPAP